MPTLRTGEDEPIDVLVSRLDDEAARRLLVDAAESHEDVMRSVRLAAADDDDRLTVLKVMVDDGLRTRRYLDYWQSTTWAQEAGPVVDALADEVATAPSAGLVLLLQRAAGHLVKVIMRADDSNGMIGGLCHDVLEHHRQACEAGVADQQKLAKWMVRFTFDDQDFFPIDPVAYADALGEKGLAVYRREVAKRSDLADTPALETETEWRLHGGFPSYAAQFAAQRLAIIDRDIDRVVELYGSDLSSPYHYQRVAQAMIELGEADAALQWARLGIAETSGWQVTKLYDLAAALLTDANDPHAVVELRRHHHERMASLATYTALRAAARAVDTWDAEVGQARAVLAERDTAGFVDALLADDEPDEAWTVATTVDGLAASQWLRLAEAREQEFPADAMAVYLDLADAVLVEADKRAYRDAVRHLKAARRAATAAERVPEFADHLAELRERNKRRPTFMAMLDKAGL